MKKLRSIVTIAALFAASLGVARAQVPGNDPFLSPTVLSGTAVTIGGTTVNATKEVGEPNHAGNAGGHSVWYEWTAPASASTTMSVVGAYRTLLGAYIGSAVNALATAGSAASVAANVPASFTFNATAGTIYKIATDGRAGASGTFTLTINQAVSPVVTLTAPTAGQTFTNPATITVSATATSPSGTVTNVSFFVGGSTLIGSDTSSPFSINWSGMADGNYTVTARATDTAGFSTTSAGVNITVRPNGYFASQLVGSNSVSGSNSWWKYLDDGTDQGTAWQGTGFDDSAWLAGPAEIGYGEALGRQATTNLSYGPDAANKYITYYFRHTFTLANATLITNLLARFERDDGMIMYLNGTEVARNNMPASGENYLTLASANAGDDGATFFATNINPALLINGVNTLATEIHQDAITSSDITWYLELTGSGANGNPAPTVSITNPVNNATFSVGANLTIGATAADSNGSVTNVAFYANGTNFLGNDTTAPYSVTWNSLPQGNYALTAVATDDQGATTISAAVNISVNSYTITPVTLIASNSVWKYLDDGSDQGTAWSLPGFPDTGWLSGPAELGYGDLPEGRPENTVLCCSNAVTKFITYYFRRTFNVADASAVSNLTLNLMRDDGAVVYVNGVEVRRDNLPAGTITSATLALAAVGTVDEYTFFSSTFGPTNLVTGANTLAVEIHQNAVTSSDISFDLELIANTLNVVAPTNTGAPFVASQNPVAGATVSTLTSVQVVFSESVTNVDATDLLVNGTPATGLSGGPAAYTFTFPQPPLGLVAITWAVSHGITDRDPAPLPFNGGASSNIWNYNIADVVAPTVLAKVPAAGSTLTNLTSVNVTFSEPVTGVNASDLLVNGGPASGLVINNATNYTFTFGQPLPGTISIGWVAAPGIVDLSPSANAFATNSAGANWSYNLTVPSSVIIASNSNWKFIKGFAEASSPIQAWRQIGFDDSSWSNSATPFFYGDPYTNFPAGIYGTWLNDMQNFYQVIYLRHDFTLTSASSVSNFIYKHQSDDGFVAWINGVEVLRWNMAASGTDPSYLPTGVGNATETGPGGNGGAPYLWVTNSAALGALVTGTNILAVQACNASIGASSDFGFNMEFSATIVELNPSNLPPRLYAIAPAAGDVTTLTSIQVTFSEPVVGVEETDLLLNGVSAGSYSGSGSNYTFTFPQPAYGPVAITWAVGHNIFDFDTPPKPFDATAGGATWNYNLINPNAPVVATQFPLAGATVSALTSVQITFNKNVSGVNASDLLISGAPASGLTGSGSNYTFTFTQPAYGNVGLSWAVNHGIFATGNPADTFDRTHAGNTWSYTLLDQTPPTLAAKTPPAGANVTNLTSLSVTYSENVIGVNAADLLINNVPATGLSGSGANYTFTFPQPNTSIINVTWAANHGITDTALNPFDATVAGATWQYFTPDTVPPAATTTSPWPDTTVRALTTIQVTFNEPVTGVNASDLAINTVPAASVAGSGAGPYTFHFPQPPTGHVDVIWAAAHGIQDLALPPNNFAGGEWTYELNPNAIFAERVVVNEIMFQPPSKSTNDEWFELKNLDAAPMHLNGWRITKGVDYQFGDVTIPPGGYLVVAANTNNFHAKYPAVTNYTGPWTGTLANHDGNIQLETAEGELVNTVHYASEGEWAVRTRGAVTANHRGWEWRSVAAEAAGPSLELVNPALPNAYGNNWRSSTATNGTPGAANATVRTNIAPLVLDMAHFPTVPRSTDPVVVTAKILDERTNGLGVTLYYRNATLAGNSNAAFTAVTMFDDGAHNDGVVNDQVWAATIPAQVNYAVIEFYVEAVDADVQTNSSPAVALDQNGVAGHYANALYQVDDTPYAFTQPLYKLIMTEWERRERDVIASVDAASNAEMNGSLITVDGTGTEIRYSIGVRERGAGSRGRIPPNHRVNVPTDRRWKGQREFNLNSQYTESQYAGYLLSRKAGLDTEYARIVRLIINNTNNANSGSPQFGCYIHVESPNSDMAAAHWPVDDGGNMYRVAASSHAANLAYLGTSGSTYSNAGYSKVSNTSEDNWNDLVHLTDVLNNTPDSNYVAAVRTVANVEQWMLYFAMNTLLVNMETSLGSGYGDDYGLYSAPREGRFYLIAHDWDTILGEGDTAGSTSASLFRTNGPPAAPTLGRLLGNPEFVSIYYATLRRLCQTTFSPAEVARTLDEGLTPFAGTANIQAMKQFASNRVAYVLSQLPSTNTVAPSSIGGTLATNTVFAAAGSPYTITSSLTVPAGITLVIQPGVTVQVAAGATITVSGTGVLLAKGTPANHIRFTKSGGNWGSLDFINAPNESRLEYVDFDSCAGTTIGGHASEIHVNGGSKVFFNFLNFTNNPAQEYISFDGSTFIVQNSTFPTYPWATSAPEMLHGVNGINAGGYGIFRSNYFGHTFGFNDTIDFTGGQRPGPILQVIGNVFDGAGDDNLDLDSTDAWIEGNIFMHVHRDPNRTDQADDTGSAISGGVDVDGQFSEWTVINNLFYDVDHVFLNKGGVGTGAGRVIFVNNTVAHVNQESGAGPSTNIAAFIFTDDQVAYPNPSYGAGAYIAGNIIWDYPKLVDNYNTNNHTIIFENNLLAGPWGGLGSNNVVADPLLNLQLITTATNATAAQVRAAFTPKTNSPALGTGFGGWDKGGLNPKGMLFISGPTGNTNSSSATLRLFPGGVFHWGTIAPNYDWGYTKYKWRLDHGPWSAELAISNAPVINLAGLPNGQHTVYVSGRNDAGYFQDDAFVYPTDGVVPAHVTASRTWTINSPGSGVRLNEVLASNQTAVNHEGTHPDLIELQNVTGAAVDVGGLRLTDDPSNPDKFIFDYGTVIPAGGYLVVYANNEDGTSGIHLGFGLNKDGQGLYLYESVDHGGFLVDSVEFGLQLADYSIGRVASGLVPEGAWQLCLPTAGGANVAAALGAASGLVINEILTAELTAFPDDFVELYNPAGLPVALEGLYFTDNPANWPGRSVVPPLTFIGAGGYIAFHADGKTSKGSDHLDFSLEAERGVVALLNPDFSVIDCVIYGPQGTDISQGRVVGNIYDNNFFTTPTPGAPNGGLAATNSGVVLNEVLAANGSIRELDGSTPDWVELYNLAVTNVDLGDWSLTDSAVTPRKYVFAPGTIIPGNGYLRLRCDGGIPAGPTNTAFNIKAEGGSLYLFDTLANGGGLLNAVTYGLQAVDFSISRVPNGSGNWALSVPTPGGASILASTASAAAVKVNEWMPKPSSGEDWFELWNPANQPVAIGGYYTTDDLNNRTKSPIPALSYLGASTNGYQRFWADNSPASGANHTSFALNNTTESVGFANPSGTLIDSITYNAPGTGVSEGRFPDGTATIVRFPGTESPGEANYLWITNVVINEALSHTDPPLEDAIELRNVSGVAVNIGNWWLSDAQGTPRKYRITNGLTIPANGYVVFYETQFNNGPLTNPAAFSLSSGKGDQVYLCTGDGSGNLTGYRSSVSFGPAQNGVSFGRYLTSDNREEFVSMSARSFGQDDPGSLAVFRTGSGLANPYPKVGPVVIAQVMYHPPDVGTNDNSLDEFIELRNIAGSAQPLYDPTAVTNTWRLRDAVDFDFPPGVSMPAGTRLLVVSFDPGSNPGQLAIFRAKYGVDGTIPIYGPYTGKLANSDDKVELYRPDPPNTNSAPWEVPYVLADRVHYFDVLPWAVAADGTGAGLSRVSLTGFGNDPTNWVAVVPNFGGGSDTDGDGMPDAWETLYGLNPNNPNDANTDLDGDGMTNLQEYIAGTNPTQANSALRLYGVQALGAGQARMYFDAVSNRTYSILYKNGMVDPVWTKLFDVTAAGTNRVLQINTAVGATNRFFWLRTPQAP